MGEVWRATAKVATRLAAQEYGAKVRSGDLPKHRDLLVDLVCKKAGLSRQAEPSPGTISQAFLNLAEAADRAQRALEAAVVVEAPPAKPAVVVVETPALETVVQPETIEETPVAVAPAEPVVEPRPAKAPHQLVERVLTQLAKPAVYPGKRTEPATVPKQRRPTNPRGRTVEARTTERELDPLERLRRAARNAAREKRSAAGSALVAVRMSSSLDGRFSGDFGGRVPMRKL